MAISLSIFMIPGTSEDLLDLRIGRAIVICESIDKIDLLVHQIISTWWMQMVGTSATAMTLFNFKISIYDWVGEDKVESQ